MYEGNGIYRHVWLLVTNNLHVKYWGTFVTTPEITKDKARIKVQTVVKNENQDAKKCELITKIVDADGYVIMEMADSHTIPALSEHEFVQTTTIDNPHLWDIDNPYLYKVYNIVKDEGEIVDVSETTFGIRSFYFDANKGFFLNGRHVKLNGFNAHYDFAGIGTAIPDRIHWNKMMAMKKAGFNFYRSSHNPATPERLDVCDKIGMLVWDEIERKLEDMDIELSLVKETIIRDRNHPSVILWSLENESPLESTVYGTRIIKAATELAHELDPTRFTTFAASMPVNKNGYGEAIDVVSYNYHWKRADQDHIDFPHWKIGFLSEYSAARARRGVYGVENFRRADNDSYLDLYWGMVQSMYEMCQRVESYWRRIKAREYLAGGCVWSGIDAWGEGNAWPLISRGDGALDMCLFKKDVYYYFVSQYTEQPMVHIFPHWNWEGKEGEPINVWCYTNCDSAELFLNGRSLGHKVRSPEPEPWSPQGNHNLPIEKTETYPEHLEWKVPYEPGTLRVVGKRDGKVVCNNEVRSAGTAYKIELTKVIEDFVERESIPPLRADAQDIVVLKASILDEDGNLVPFADGKVDFSIQGNGKIIGVGNGDIASHEANKATNRKAYNGLCAVIVQSTLEAGEIIINASSPDLKPGKFSIKSISTD
jgi:beta-galactosidase